MMGMGKKKQAKRTEAKKAPSESEAPIETPPKRTGKPRPPAMKAAGRTTKKSGTPASPSKRLPTTGAPVGSPAPEGSAPTPREPASSPPDSISDSPPAANRPQSDRTISLEEIRHRAYLKWEAAGKPDGNGAQFWIEAEQELLQQS